MMKLKEIIKQLNNTQKIYIVLGLSIFVVLLSISIPSLARYKNRLPINIDTVWDGTIATGYRSGSGTEEDPYIISNGSELAYFQSMLKETDYKDTYFKLNNNIVINNGIFSYDEQIKYTLNTSEFYIKEITNEFYDNAECTGVKIGNINSFNSIDGFKGHFDGDSYIIYGLYIYGTEKENALFTNLGGTVENLYLKNSMIYGGHITSGLASTTDGATLKNIMNEGYVIGVNDITNTTLSTDIANIEKTVSGTKTEEVQILENIPTIDGDVILTSISGNLVVEGSGELYINNTLVEVDSEGNFNITLGDTIKTTISISYNGTNATYKLTNLQYKIDYKQLVSGGIVGIANNTTIENVINKAYVYGNVNSGGLIGLVNENINILQSYNTGSVNAVINAGGLIGSIKDSNTDITITKVYNNGNVTSDKSAGIISEIKNNIGSVIISNGINLNESEYVINTIENSSVTITNSYRNDGNALYSGNSNGQFELSANLTDKEFLIDTLGYSEFIDKENLETNTTNVWMYEEDNLPILFIDDILNPIATLYVNTESWNNIGYELEEVNYDSTITFKVAQMSDLRPIDEIYYYISNDKRAYTKSEIENISEDEWIPYTDTVQITNEGFYVIYIKLITSNQVSYINSDLLVLDLSAPLLSISYDDKVWNEFTETLDYLYIDKPTTFKVTSEDTLSGIKEVSYYVSTGLLMTEELEKIETWIPYEKDISINELGSYIIYAKAIDNVNKITYANTDVITYGGYSLNSIYVGRNKVDESVNLTSQSDVTFNYTYSDTNPYKEGYTHNLISSVSLPIGTKITITDNINSKKYIYTLEEEKTSIAFTLFKEIGMNKDINFTETVLDTINEDYSVNLDFKNATIDSNILDLKLYLEIYDADLIKVRTTLESTIRGINIYKEKSSTYINTSYNGTSISYDSNSQTNIPLTAGINFPTINSVKINDTIIEDMILGLAIKMVDSDGNIVEKKHLKNIKYSINDVTYGIDDDGIARINLNNSINTFNDNLVITTKLDNSTLDSGNYYIKINSYASYDGKYSDELSTSVVTIPVTNATSKITYSFDVIFDDVNKMISKEEESTKLHFDILQNGSIYSPNIRISLYKKDKLTAYDQGYTLVNLQEYVTNTLEEVSENVYYAVKNPLYYTGYKDSYNSFDLNLINSKFENTGYKFVFELYDGTKKIGTIEKKIIARVVVKR